MNNEFDFCKTVFSKNYTDMICSDLDSLLAKCKQYYFDFQSQLFMLFYYTAKKYIEEERFNLESLFSWLDNGIENLRMLHIAKICYDKSQSLVYELVYNKVNDTPIGIFVYDLYCEDLLNKSVDEVFCKVEEIISRSKSPFIKEINKDVMFLENVDAIKFILDNLSKGIWHY